ncbi:MAG: (Fe-S)-binding protein [Nitrospirae bacterium]|nr:(Fe-S)-binding protein [Nitrospirota bacterium]
MEDSIYLEKLSKCIRCGSCKAYCPTYDEVSSEAMSARGRLVLLWMLASGQLETSSLLNDRIFSCTLCGKCISLCPLEIDIKEVIYHGRKILRKTDKKRKLLRFFLNLFTKNSNLSFNMLNSTKHILLPYLKKKVIPFPFELPEHTLKGSLHVITVPKKRGRVAVFTGCAVNFLLPHIGESLINVLHELGYEVILPAGEVCCGSPLRAVGLEEEAIKLARKNKDLYKRLNVEAVLSLCPTCTLSLKEEYPKMIGEGIDAIDISLFLSNKIDYFLTKHPKPKFKSAIYHDPCHLKYGLGIEKEPREILKNIGIDLIPHKSDRCCGFAGTFCFSFREISEALLNNCIKEYSSSGAEMIVTSCPGCIIQLAKGFKNKPVIHIIEVIEEAIFQLVSK